MKTIKEMADLMGLSKPSVMNRIESLGLRDRLVMDTKRKGRLLVDEETEKALLSDFLDGPQSDFAKVGDNFAQSSQSNFAKVGDDLAVLAVESDLLRSQLESKEHELETLRKQLDAMTALNAGLMKQNGILTEQNAVQSEKLADLAGRLLLLTAPKEEPTPAEPAPVAQDPATDQHEEPTPQERKKGFFSRIFGR